MRVRNNRKLRGFSLVEVILALGIATFALVILLALLPMGANRNRETTEESLTSNLLGAIVADVRNSPTNQPSALFGITPHPRTVTASRTNIYWLSADGLPMTSSLSAHYRLEVQMIPTNNALSVPSAWFRISWPAQAAREKALGDMETFQAFRPQP